MQANIRQIANHILGMEHQDWASVIRMNLDNVYHMSVK